MSGLKKQKKGELIVLSGPSGVGKSTVLKALLEQRKNVYFSVSATRYCVRPRELTYSPMVPSSCSGGKAIGSVSAASYCAVQT